MSRDTLTITDNRTGQTYELPIEHGTIRATDLRKIKADAEDFGLMTYDPGFMNTAACKSRITYIDGDAGILRYRGYPIEQLAERSSFLEVAYLLWYGTLPTESQFREFTARVMANTLVHEQTKRFISSFRHDAHAMGVFLSTAAALSTFFKDVKNIADAKNREEHFIKIVAKVPTIAAFCFRHSTGMPVAYPNPELSYTGNYLHMMFKGPELNYKPNPVLERALDILFILHADHEQNCSTTTMRGIGSSHCDPFTALAGAAAALYGPLHGGANEAVLRMLNEIGSKDRIPQFIKEVKSGEGKRLMGFGHRVYKNYDPRARIIKRTAEEVFEVTGRNPLIDIAIELERIALQDDYFVSRKLYPNVDFYSGIIYEAMGFPVEFFPVLFAIPRTPGWLSQWEEQVLDPEQKIVRPRQIYLGEDVRDYVPIEERSAEPVHG